MSGFTGERYIPTIRGEMRHEHLHRYAFAAALVKGLDIVDLACGEGYGTAILSSCANVVVGVDIDENTVAQARVRYGAISNARFIAGAMSNTGLESQRFDAVICFEAIEHVSDQQSVFGEIVRLLKPGGFVIMSTPNKEIYDRGRREPNPFHVKELSESEFSDLVSRNFENSRKFFQKNVVYNAIVREDNNQAYTGLSLQGNEFLSVPPQIRDAKYIIEVASNGQLPVPQDDATLLVDYDDDLATEDSKMRMWAGQLAQELRHKSVAVDAAQATSRSGTNQARWSDGSIIDNLRRRLSVAAFSNSALANRLQKEESEKEQARRSVASLEVIAEGLRDQISSLSQESDRLRVDLADESRRLRNAQLSLDEQYIGRTRAERSESTRLNSSHSS